MPVRKSVHYVQTDVWPTFAGWLTNNSLFVVYSDGTCQAHTVVEAPETVLQQGAANIVKVCRSVVGRSIFVLTVDALDVYVGSFPPTVLSFPIESLDSAIAVCVAPDDDRLLAVGADGDLWLFKRTAGWTRVGALRLRKPICACQLNMDTFAFGSAHGELEIVSVNCFESRFLRRIHADAVQDIQAIDSLNFVTVSRDKHVSCWGIADEVRKKWTIRNRHDHFINCLSIVGGRVWTGSSDGVLTAARLTDRRRVAHMQLHDDAIRSFEVSPSQKRLVTTSDDGTYKVLSLRSPKVLYAYGSPRTHVVSADVALSDKHYEVILGRSNGEVLLVKQHAKAPEPLLTMPSPVRAIAFVDAHDYVCGLEDGTVHRCTSDRSKKVAKGDGGAIYSFCIDPTQQRLWCGRRSGLIDTFSLSRLSCAKTNQIHQSIVGDILHIHEGQLLSCSDDQTIKLLDAHDLRVLKSVSLGSSAVNNVLCCEAKVLASSDDGRVFILDPLNHTVVGVYDGHDAPVRALCTTDGEFIASGDREGWVRLWDIHLQTTVWKTKFRTRVVRLRFDALRSILLVITENEVTACAIEIGEIAHARSIFTSGFRGTTSLRKSKRPLVLVSALYKERDELLAAVETLNELRWEESFDDAQIIDRRFPETPLAIVKAIGKSGNVASREVADALIQRYNPSMVLLFGIAAGVRGNTSVGALVMTNQIWDLRKCRVGGNDQFDFEPNQISCREHFSLPFEVTRLEGKLSGMLASEVRVILDLACGSSDNLIRSEAYMRAAANTHRKLGAVEMEAAGVAETCNAYSIPFCVAKAISDYGDEHKTDESHEYCCKVVALAILHGFLLPIMNRS